MHRPLIHKIYAPLLAHFRAGRLGAFYKMNDVSVDSRILDVGGTVFMWNLASSLGLPLPREIVILNLYKAARTLPGHVRWICADARRMPFADGEFDVVFSNSVIEHLADAESQKRMADEIRRVGRSYWVQTPDPRFPVEPHYLTPFIHWIPPGPRRKLVRNGTLWGWLTRPDYRQIDERLAEIRLIRRTEFRSLFPDGQIMTERFLGLPKALIAVRGSQKRTLADSGASLVIQVANSGICEEPVTLVSIQGGRAQ
jgi:hypothetical protein